MSRTKEAWSGRIVPGSMRAEGSGTITFNIILDRDPDRIIRISEPASFFEERFVKEFDRQKERLAARSVFKLGE